jgi:putative MATE family efflux protein
MNDLTRGSVASHIARLSAPIAAGMLFQALYFLVDLYFIATLGDAALAGASSAGNVTYAVSALSQVLGVGTVVLVAHAAGRKDRAAANLVFNQSLVLAVVCSLLVLLAGYGLTSRYLLAIAADERVVESGRTYLSWFMPALALQFVVVAASSALRGVGVVRPALIVQTLTVILNAMLAPILVVGWGTHYPLGVAGAGLASSLSVIAGVILFWIYVARFQRYLAIDPTQWRPRLQEWQRMLKIGLPAGGEFLLLFAYTAIIYWAIRDFGSVAQAGFGVGTRILQVALMPVMAVAAAVTSVAGQNFGARQPERVRQSFRAAVLLATAVMLTATLLLAWLPDSLSRVFSRDTDTVATASAYLFLLSWSFVAYGLVFVCSGLFQSLGNTRPALATSTIRFLVFVSVVAWLSTRPDYRLEYVWYAALATVWLHAFLNLSLLQYEFRKRMPAKTERSTASPAAASNESTLGGATPDGLKQPAS